MADNVKQVGKILRKNQDEVDHNIRRGAENFPTPEINVQDFNKLFKYKKTFEAHSDASVHLNVRLKEITTPCSINPPMTDIWCRAKFSDNGPPYAPSGYTTSYNYPITMLENNGKMVYEDGAWVEHEFILNGDGSIIVPADGCYGIQWTSGAWGVSIEHSNHNQIATFYHNGKVVYTHYKPTTGIIHTLGPFYWQMPSIPHLYVVIEAKAGDTILATLTDDGINECWEWWGCRRGFFVWQGTTEIRMDLIAEAENV